MFICISVLLAINAVYRIFRCNNPRLGAKIAMPRFYIYALQSITLTFVLFERLVFIFKDTQFRLSQCTIILYISLVIIGSLTVVTAFSMQLFFDTQYQFIALVLSSFAALDYVFLVIWLNVLFVRKVSRVQASSNMNKNNRQKLLDTIIKSTILCITSTSFIILYLVVYLVYVGTSGSLILFVVTTPLFIADLYSNFLCVLLSYSYFNRWYYKLCGKCHRQCISYWNSPSKEINKQRMLQTACKAVSDTADQSQTENP